MNLPPVAMPHEPAPESASDPEAVAKALELELMGKRALWQQAKARRGTWRGLSILFLVLVLAGAALVYFYFVSHLRHDDGARPPREDARSSETR